MNADNAWQALRYVLDDPTLDRAAFENRMLSDIDLAMSVAGAVRQIATVKSAASRPAVVVARGARQSDERDEPGGTARGWHWSSVAALAAASLLAVGLGIGQLDSFRQMSATDSSSASADAVRGIGLADSGGGQDFSSDALASAGSRASDFDEAVGIGPGAASDGTPAAFQHFVAEHWLAMRREVLASDALEGSDALYGNDEARDGLPSISNGDGEADADDDWMLEAAREFYKQGVAS